MMQDRYGLELSTSSSQARDLYVEGVDRMLAADDDVEVVLDAAVEADPAFALAHAAIARQHQLMMRGPQARAAAETAVALAIENATEREREHAEIVQDLVSGQVPRSLERTHEHLASYPRDAFVLAPAAGVFGTIGFSGRIDREAEQLALLEPLATHYGDDWWFQMVHAFALVETGDWKRGRPLAERSLDQRPDNAHGAHTLAHALYEAGADEESRDFLDGWLPGRSRDSLMYCHNWWHYALALLALGQVDEAFQAFEQNCLPGSSSSPAINVFTDSASFLWRAELAGADRSVAHWETVHDHYQASFRRPIVFVDAHIGLVHAALGQANQLDECIASLQELGEAGRLPAGTLGAELTVAYKAFGAGDWASATELLERLMDQVVRIGGSRAQRDVQTATLLAAYINDGRLGEAHALVDSLADRQPNFAVAGWSGD